MPRVEITCSVEVPERPVTLVELEELAGEQARRLAREIIQRGIEASEPAVLEATPGARQRIRSWFVLTQFGEVRFARWKVRRPDGTYTYPLDAALGLEPHQTVSPMVTSTLTWLAATMPFQVAADVSSRLWGFTVNPKRVWRLTQKAGERIRDLFIQGLGGPPPDLPCGQARHEMVVVQADGTGLRCREGPTEAKIAAGTPTPRSFTTAETLTGHDGGCSWTTRVSTPASNPLGSSALPHTSCATGTYASTRPGSGWPSLTQAPGCR